MWSLFRLFGVFGAIKWFIFQSHQGTNSEIKSIAEVHAPWSTYTDTEEPNSPLSRKIKLNLFVVGLSTKRKNKIKYIVVLSIFLLEKNRKIIHI